MATKSLSGSSFSSSLSVIRLLLPVMAGGLAKYIIADPDTDNTVGSFTGEEYGWHFTEKYNLLVGLGALLLTTLVAHKMGRHNAFMPAYIAFTWVSLFFQH